METPLEWGKWVGFLDMEALTGRVPGQMAVFLLEICFEGESTITQRGRAAKEGPGRLCLVNDQTGGRGG